MLRFDSEDIAADRFCFFRFAEGAIEFRFFDGLGDSSGRDALHFISHGLSLQTSVYPTRNSPSSTTFHGARFRIVEDIKSSLIAGIRASFSATTLCFFPRA